MAVENDRSSPVMGFLFLCVLVAGTYFYFHNQSFVDESSSEERRNQTEEQRQLLPERQQSIRGQLLLDEQYLPSVKQALRGAEQSIQVIMYVFRIEQDKPDDPAFQLARLLRRKARQDVDVRVLLAESDHSPDLEHQNERTARYLRQGPVTVHVSNAPGKIHGKGVLIDQNTLFLGNHNWSWAALKYNGEVSMAFRGSGVKKHAVPRFNEAFRTAKNPRRRR